MTTDTAIPAEIPRANCEHCIPRPSGCPKLPWHSIIFWAKRAVNKWFEKRTIRYDYPDGRLGDLFYAWERDILFTVAPDGLG